MAKLDAVTEYISDLHEILNKLIVITNAALDHFGVGPDEVNYSHVGNLGYVNERLDEILSFMDISSSGY